MGSYLSEPITKKESSDASNDKLSCGASSMQGWRLTQEDAHNTILDFDNNTAFFAVYDGHGGHEVAEYSAKNLPDFIKSTQAYKDGNLEKALIDGFLGFDATITLPEVIEVLKEIAGDKEAKEETEDEDDEENVNNLYEEATMPIEQVIEKYTSNIPNPAIKSLKKDGKLPKSPYLKPKRENEVGTSTSSEAGGSEGVIKGPDASSTTSSSAGSSGSSSSDGVSSSSSDNEAKSTKDQVVTLVKTKESNGTSSELKAEDTKVVSSDSKAEEAKVASSETSEASKAPEVPDIKISSPVPDSSDSKEAAAKTEKEKETPTQNGESATVTSSQENGEVTSKKGKGKAIVKLVPKTPSPRRVSERLEKQGEKIYKKLLDFEDAEEDSEDDEDKTFEGPQQEDSEDSDEEQTSLIEDEGSDATSEDLEEEEDEDMDEEDLEEEEEMDDYDLEFTRNMKEEPGSDSGCTAVVAVMRGSDLYVANAGDSRCVVCRDGKAVEMSFDHKPEDEPERERIVAAGGKVTLDGRVNSGLNLSRALGDHAYKQNTGLPAEKQMITSLPDIKHLQLNPNTDQFMVLACDGIWNFMSSQEVVDFVKEKLDKGVEKLSTVVEQLFDHCLAPNTAGDGTGCDNMTAIIVEFKKGIAKRPASPSKDSVASTEDGETDAKKRKTEPLPTE